MFGIMDNLGDDTGKNIAVGIGTFIMTAVMILTVISFIFSWLGSIQFILTITSLVIFVFLWSVVIDCCSD